MPKPNCMRCEHHRIREPQAVKVVLAAKQAAEERREVEL